MPPEGLVTEGSLPFGIFHCFDRAVLDRLSLIAGEDLVAAELLAAVYGDFELAQDPKAADGSSLMDAFLHFDRRRGEEAFKFLTGVFARNAPREIFMMFDGKVENPDREAMILRNISDATRDYWWNLRQRRILSTYFDMDRYTVRMDTSATTLARCVRRVLSGKISPAVNRLVTLTFATHSSPGVSEVAWKWLKRMPPDAKNIEMVDAYPEGLGKKAALRIISWLDPVADIEVSARSVLRSALNSPVEEVRNSAAKILVRNFGPDDATTTLISMAFGENEVGKAIRDSLPPGLVDDRLQSDVLPSLLNGTLSTVAKSYLPAWVGRDGRVTSAFMAMVADTERRWDNRGAAELANIMFMMRDSRASIPNAMWALFSSCIGRSTGSYHLAMASCALALAHPMVVPGHDMVLRLLHDEAYWVDTCPTSARLAAVNVAFRTRLIRLLNSDALPPIVHGTLVKELALVGDDDELQGFAAETLEQAIRDPRVETEHILSSLGSVNWGNRLITAVEALAEGSSDIQLELVRLLATRIPGTARVLPQGNQERTAALEDVYSQMSSLFAFPLSEIPTERSGYEGLIEEFEWRENGPQLCLERTGVAGRSPALVWLQNYEFDPHHAFWNYMPDALVRILIETRTDDGGVPVRGSETLTLEFKDKIMLRSELNEFLSAKFSGEDLPTSPWKTSRTDRFGSDYAQRRAKEVALAVIRSNLGLLCRRSSEPSSATTFEIERPRKLGSSVVEPSTLGRELLHFHPHLFFKAYRETAFSDAYDLNARKVLKKGPAERVIPALGLNANEKARLQHDLVFLEKIACQWLLSGAQVVDMTGWSGVNHAVNGGSLRSTTDESTIYVKTADEDGDIKKPDGFYVQYLEASGQRPAGYILAFTHTGSGDLDDTTEVARRISAQHQLFIPAGLPLEKAVAARLVVRTTPGFQVPSYDDILIAARILHLVQNGTKREICGRDKGYIPVPIGRNGEAGARWLADASPISTYFPLSRKVVSLSDERPVIRNLRRDTILIEDRPNETTLTVFVLEDIDGSWKRVRRGDWRGTNGNARFSHLAGSKCRLVVAAAYMTGRKVSGIKSLRPKYAVFDAHGSLTPALFGDSMREYLDFDRKPEDPLPEWEIMEREIVEITELILTSRRSDDLLPR